MANNWNSPTLSSLYQDVLSELKARQVSISKLDYTGDTNLHTNAIRSNSSNDDKLERYNGSTWDTLQFIIDFASHIADTSIHEPFESGDLKMAAYATPTSGWLLCDGSAVSRTTYSSLFSAIGTKYGSGDGSTTFNVPNYKGKSPIGVDSGEASIDDAGKSIGSINHTHTTPNHQHTIATHTHDMGNHTHTAPAHTHSIPSHTHSVPAHYHGATGNGADIAIGTSGSHTHPVKGKEGGSNGSDGDRAQGTSSTSGTDVTWSDGAGSSGSGHTHDNSAFSGNVGNVSSGISGDASMTTGSGGSGTSGSGGNSATSTPSTNTTGGSGTLTSNSGEGGSTTGTGNAPALTCYFFIKT